jgi:hypothetical protein
MNSDRHPTWKLTTAQRCSRKGAAESPIVCPLSHKSENLGIPDARGPLSVLTREKGCAENRITVSGIQNELATHSHRQSMLRLPVCGGVGNQYDSPKPTEEQILVSQRNRHNLECQKLSRTDRRTLCVRF